MTRITIGTRGHDATPIAYGVGPGGIVIWLVAGLSDCDRRRAGVIWPGPGGAIADGIAGMWYASWHEAIATFRDLTD